MKVSVRSVAFCVAGTALAAGLLTTPAAAQSPGPTTPTTTVTVHHRGDGTPVPAQLGNPSEWGVVTVTAGVAAGPAEVDECTNPSAGGTWCYGWYLSTSGGQTLKKCYSNYYHPSQYHTSTAEMNGDTDRSGAVAGDVSQASIRAGLIYRCSTYYAVY
ncbi:lactococcin 972 family bacteriocin [Streptomyces sp. NPDC020719]|uniref:lactococcin 972 family bacteriocin n=1 Tax=Streptomyces sp. NPDC020719 TaxID=3154896 RepID=UPI0033D2D951